MHSDYLVLSTGLDHLSVNTTVAEQPRNHPGIGLEPVGGNQGGSSIIGFGYGIPKEFSDIFIIPFSNDAG